MSSHRGIQRYYQYKEWAFWFISSAMGDDEPRCRSDTLPEEHPLKDYPCYGELQIDHVNGGGRKEYRRPALVQQMAYGHRGPDGLRLLCQLHQLWNQERET